MTKKERERQRCEEKNLTYVHACVDNDGKYVRGCARMCVAMKWGGTQRLLQH